MALLATLSSVSAFGSRCPSGVSLERWHECFGVLVLFVWVTEGQLDSTPVFSLYTSSLLLPASLPKAKVFTKCSEWPVPRVSAW